MQDLDLASILHGGMITTLKLCTPLLIAPLVCGLIVAILQAVTQISDSTVSFLPKLMATGAAAWLAGPFMARTMSEYMHVIFDTLVSIGGQ
jgi:flagellar biosynthetic protein FliQ